MVSVGEFVRLGERLGVVVVTGESLGGDLADHSGVWFGTHEQGQPAVWLVPTDLLEPAPAPVLRH